MNNFRLAHLLRHHLQRYRIAAVAPLLKELPERHRSQAMEILKTNTEFQVFKDMTDTACVCQRRNKTPSLTAIARCVAAQAFCQSAKSRRTLLTKNELAQFFPTLFRHGLPAGYYVHTTTETPVLGLLRVDIRFSPANRIVKRSLTAFEKHRHQSTFRKLILSHQFEITWLVATESKANSIRQSVARQACELPVNAHAEIYLLNQLSPLTSTSPDVVGL